MTKMETLALIKELCADNADVVAFCESETEKLEKKAIKAREKAAEKRAAGDALYADVVACLTSEAQTADVIYANNFATYDDLTLAKIRARLSQAVKNGAAAKESVKLDGKVKVVYTLAN